MKVQVFNQINIITSKLISVNLAESQNFPSEKDGKIYISGDRDLSIALKNISYENIYHRLSNSKNYNVKMLDGALIQLMYQFDSEDNLQKYRLAFFPSPTLEEFQNNEDIYESDDVYADILNKNIVTTPIRFDYDPTNFQPLDHPNSHMTIGQYKNCRIPVNCPISPFLFITFILRNFYNTANNKFSEELKFENEVIFPECIDDLEKSILHLSVA